MYVFDDDIINDIKKLIPKKRDRLRAATLASKIAETFAEKDCWIKGAFARDKYQNIVKADSDHAEKWCAVGMMLRFQKKFPKAQENLSLVRSEPFSYGLTVFNDSQVSVNPVIKYFKDLAKALEK